MSGDLPKGILFDLDDTILEQENPDLAWEKILKRYAPIIGESTPGAILQAILDRRVWFWGDPERHRKGRLNPARAVKQIVSDAFASLGIDDPRIIDEMIEAFRIQREEAERPYPGAMDALRSLREQGIKMALVTNGNKDTQRRKVERHELEGFFDSILIEGEIGIGKPDPRVYHHALDKLNVMPKDAWMVGDNLEWEVAAPQRLGMFGVWVDSSGKGLPEDSNVTPDRIVAGISELV